MLHKPGPWRVGLGFFLITSLSVVMNNAQVQGVVAWAGYTPLQAGVDNTLSYALITLTILGLKRYCLHVSWRKLYATGIVTMQVFALAFLLVVFVCPLRDGWFFIFIDLDNQVAYDITFFLNVVMVPELVEPGLEGSTYGAFTTLTNAAQNVAGAISIELLGVWDLSGARLARDDHGARLDMARLQLLASGIALASLLFLPLLPVQKDDCARLRGGAESRVAASVVMGVIIVGMVYGAVMTTAPLIPSLGCEKWAGGSGCGAGDDDGAGLNVTHDGYC